MVGETWNNAIEGSKGLIVSKKIKACRIALLGWSRNININNKKEICKLKEELKRMMNNNMMDKHTKMTELKNKLRKGYQR